MKTLLSTGPQLLAVETPKTPGVTPGTVRVKVVKYETYEIPDADFDAMRFQIHDANQEHAKLIAAAVNL